MPTSPHTLDRHCAPSSALAFANGLLAGAAAATVATARAVQAGERLAYIEALKRHDWTHEYSDDGRAYEAGRDSLRALKRMQPVVDPDGALWNAAAPAEFRLVVAA